MATVETFTFLSEDFYTLVRKSETSRVILTNHAYLLTRLEDDKVYFAKSVLVVDEAQKPFFALEQVFKHCREKKPCTF